MLLAIWALYTVHAGSRKNFRLGDSVQRLLLSSAEASATHSKSFTRIRWLLSTALSGSAYPNRMSSSYRPHIDILPNNGEANGTEHGKLNGNWGYEGVIMGISYF